MLCTHCFSQVKPVVAWDIDGTLAKYHDEFMFFAVNYFGRPFRAGYDGSVSLAEWMRISKDEYRQCKLAYRLGGNKRFLKPYSDGGPQIARLIHNLRDRGAEIWMTTTRPYLRLDNIDPDTREWLSRHNIHYDGLIYEEDKYSALLNIVGPDRVIGVVEDEAEQYDRAEALGLRPIQILRHHNLTCRRPVQAASLAVAAGMLNDRLDRWKEIYDFYRDTSQTVS